ncbi:MAG: hypothetical protein HJHJAOHD_02313 [Flavobacteriales bacterium]|nr:hypothetical protein [Flavobacteriales bacterium]
MQVFLQKKLLKSKMTIKTRILNLFRRFFMISFLERIIKQKIEKNPHSFFAKLAPNNYQYKKGSFRKFTYNGVQLKADISDYIGYCLYFGFKEEGQEKLINLAQPGNVVLDIGTNIGSTLLQLAKRIGENGKVYGFEPDEQNYNACLENISINSFHNVDVSNIGLGDKKGTYTLVVDTDTNRGGNRISFDNESKKSNSKIEVERLDDWIKNRNLTRVDLIKIDVEGFELNVLKGAEESIRKYTPVLFIELDDNNLKAVGSSASQLVQYLENMGYFITNAETEESVLSVADFNNCHYDIICKIK